MAQSDATKLSDFSGFLTPEQSAPIFEKARQGSVVQQLAKQVPMGPNGVQIPVTTGHLVADWVDEGAEKPTSEGSMNLVTLVPKKIAVISVVSEETVRANPGGYVTAMRDEMAEAFAKTFDAAALHNKRTAGSGASPFPTYIDSTSKAVGLGSTAAASGGVFADLNKALALVVEDGDREVNGFAFDTIAEPILNGSVDTAGRPLFIDGQLTDVAPSVRGGTVLGRTTRMGKGVAAVKPGSAGQAYPVGYAGDWSQVVWGQVGGITYRVSNEATVSLGGALTSLWQRNLVAVLAEAEYAFYVHDPASFVKLTRTTA